MTRKHSIIFIGGDFGTSVFQRLLDDGFEIKGIILNPKRTTKNFSQKIQLLKEYTYHIIQKLRRTANQQNISQTLILKKAAKNKIKVIQPNHLNQSAIGFIRSLAPDLIIVAGYTKIIPEIILNIPIIGSINIHPSLLPQYRGPAPTFWQIVNGERLSGITVHFIDKGIDTGDIILQRTIDIEDEDTNGTLFMKLVNFGADVTVEALNTIEKGSISTIKQSHLMGSYAPKCSKKDTRVYWSKTAVQINNLFRACNPWPGAYSIINGFEMTIWKAEIIAKHISMKPGEIVAIGRDYFDVQTGDDILRLREYRIKNGMHFIKIKSALSVGAVFD